MNISFTFLRVFIILLSILFLTTYVSATTEGSPLANLVIGSIFGLIFGLGVIVVELGFKRFNLRTFNIIILGLFIGYLMGQAVLLMFNSLLDTHLMNLAPKTEVLVRIGIFLFTAYMGMTMTARAADEIYISLPFVRFKPTSHKKKDTLVDLSALLDSRILDLAASGLLDYQLLVPRFVVKEKTLLLESSDEALKARARRCLDTLKKLENLPSLEMRYVETDFPELADCTAKYTRLARILDANLLTSDLCRIQQAQTEGIRVININLLANALKPITQSGEFLNIKIQRYGKEPRQGVGYLEDGTMVVVNGGAEFIGETIKALVLSVKHTSSGRMIFCNASDEHSCLQEPLKTLAEIEETHKSYYTL